MADTVLIVDDDDSMKEFLRNDLQNKFQKIVIVEQPGSFESFKKAAPETGNFEVLLDFNLPLNWLSECGKDVNLANRARIWIITGTPDLDIKWLKKTYPALYFEERWFDKTEYGLTDEIIRVIRNTEWSKPPPNGSNTKKGDGLIPKWIEDYPYPVRVVNGEGDVVETNLAWRDNPYMPALDLEDLQHDFNKSSKQWNTCDGWGPLPKATNYEYVENGFYTLQQRVINEEYLIQCLIEHHSNQIDLQSKIKQLLEVVAGSGYFKRARFYRVHRLPGWDGSITLEQQVGGIKRADLLPYSRPLIGKISERLKRYEKKSRANICKERMVK
jgi:hypothetical protein